MKKIMIAALGLLLILSGCAPKLDANDKVVQKNKTKKAEKGIMTKNQISSDFYKTVLPYKASKSRGLVVSNINSRYDINELETGLMRISQNDYSPDNYLFQEGQYLDKETLTKWLDRKSKKNSAGLNPTDNGFGENRNPIYLAHILEQDYLKKVDKDTVALGGISIALAMNSVDYYQKEEYGDTFEQAISDSELLSKGKSMANTILNRIRQTKGLGNVPVTIAIYKQGQRNAVVPGNFLAYSTTDNDNVGNWKNLNEKYYVLGSSEAAKKYKTDNDSFLNFKADIEDYYPNYTGVVGRARYENNQLSELDIDIPLQFYGEAEIIGFSQYITDLVGKYLPKDADIQINISTSEGPAALITRSKEDDKAVAHIYN